MPQVGPKALTGSLSVNATKPGIAFLTRRPWWSRSACRPRCGLRLHARRVSPVGRHADIGLEKATPYSVAFRGKNCCGDLGRFGVRESFSAWSRREDVARSGGDAGLCLVFAFFVKGRTKTQKGKNPFSGSGRSSEVVTARPVATSEGMRPAGQSRYERDSLRRRVLSLNRARPADSPYAPEPPLCDLNPNGLVEVLPVVVCPGGGTVLVMVSMWNLVVVDTCALRG
ncbi:hypothetical protein Taro_034963 [Colocasia esculenta]|uniref:Uncharacterized protein n=1 Tax=Colocasia esculenta TaxID=4460 RepID=A0A843W5C5_COLES|nr:hypothetical protein [Colocasia esculenta]